jgi:hypothetical protein
VIPPTRSGSPIYAANQRKTFRSCLGRLLQTEFPQTFGPAVTRLFAEKIDELYDRCHLLRDRVRTGQILWLAVAANERPGRAKRIEDTRLVPVLLDLVTRQDIDDTVATHRRLATRQVKIVRLFRQAFEQGGVLSEADVALILHVEVCTVSRDVLDHERETGESVPRRGTLHDLGRSISHKAIICHKRLVLKKSTSEVAQETYHSPEEVEYYVQCLRRIQLCRDNGMSPDDIALATKHSRFLVREYLDLIEELQLPTLAEPDPPETTKNGRPQNAK